MSDRNKKREQFEQQKASRNKFLMPLSGMVLVLSAVTAWFVFAQGSDGHQAVVADGDGHVRLAVSDFHDGQAQFYRYQSASGPVDFFLVKSRDGVIRAAFDSCDVCYRELKGYRQDGHEMVCVNCDQRFPTDKINVVKGGCNPAPLKRQQVGSQIVIAASDINLGARFFAGRVN